MALDLKQLINPAHWSIRWRLTAWFVSCVLLILTIACLVVFYGFRGAIIADTDRSLTISAAAIITQVTGGDMIRHRDSYSAPPLTPAEMRQNAQVPFSEQQFDSSGDPIYIRLIDTTDKSIVASSANIMRHGFVEKRLNGVMSLAAGGDRAFFVGSDKENELRVMLMPVPRSPYLLQLATPWARNEQMLDPATETIVWTVAFFLVISGFGGWLLVGRTLRPINDIVKEAEKFRGDRLEPSFIAARSYGSDEIGGLVTALNSMMARVHRSVAAQRQFTADASHDLRTPLTILRGEIEFALAKERTPKEYREALARGLEAAERLIRIVADLGDLVSVDADGAMQQGCDPSPVDLAELCRNVLNSRQFEADARRITLSFRDQSGAHAAVASADPLALERAIANVIDNAIRYNRAGGSVEVIVGAIGDNQIAVEIVDTGIGISESDRPFIFDRFYRGDKARRSSDEDERGSSSGLGLAIARHAVASCGGKLTVTSEVDVGSRFTLLLPRLDSTEAGLTLTKA